MTPTYHYMPHGDGECRKVKLRTCQWWLLKLLLPKRDPPSCQAQLQETLLHVSS